MRPVRSVIFVSFVSSAVIALAAILAAGCAARPKGVNSSFPLTAEAARADLARIARDRRPLDRPVVVLGGFADPGLGGWVVGAELRRYVRDERIVTVSFVFCDSFDACRRRVIDAVDRAFPTDDPNQTVEVDVIGLSMGGLVGRYCAADFGTPVGEMAPSDSTSSPLTPALSLKGRGSNAPRRLRVHTLFTASSPHLGAVRAERLPKVMRMQEDMTPGSEFLRRLEEAENRAAPREIVPYVRAGDDVVGAANAAPRGRVAWWVPNPPGEFAHVGAMTDPRILADVLRRLRGEKPWTNEPPAPLPK
jgi:hypothetical protein